MHAVMITFQSSAHLDDLVAPFTDYARALEGVRHLERTLVRGACTLTARLTKEAGRIICDCGTAR